jgi:hypothetical protein
LEQCVNCRVPHSVSSLLFDHKAVFLCFRRENPYKKQIINYTILKDADLDEIALITAIECYINHLLPSENYSDIDIQNFKMHLGLIIQYYKELVGIRLMEAENGIDQTARDRVGVIKNSIQMSLDILLSLDTLQTLELNCDHDAFLEVLIMSVENSSLAHQHDFFKIKNAKHQSLEKRIKLLKQNFNDNTAEILRTERDLNKVADNDMREEVLKMARFELLNNEKITPYFLSLAKKPHDSSCLVDICNDDSTPFETSTERDSYIEEYYASTYKRVDVVLHNNAINDFLGDIVNNPVVVLSKLNVEERETLERGITIQEFDKAIEKAKLNTSPGIDSISNRFIKNFGTYSEYLYITALSAASIKVL